MRSRWKFDVSWTSIIRSRLLSASRIGGFFGWSSEPSASGKLSLAGGDVNPKPGEHVEVARPDRADGALIRPTARRRSGCRPCRAAANAEPRVPELEAAVVLDRDRAVARTRRARSARSGAATAARGWSGSRSAARAAAASPRTGCARRSRPRASPMPNLAPTLALETAAKRGVETEPVLECLRGRLHAAERDQLRGDVGRPVGRVDAPAARSCGTRARSRRRARS